MQRIGYGYNKTQLHDKGKTAASYTILSFGIKRGDYILTYIIDMCMLSPVLLLIVAVTTTSIVNELIEIRLTIYFLAYLIS